MGVGLGVAAWYQRPVWGELLGLCRTAADLVAALTGEGDDLLRAFPGFRVNSVGEDDAEVPAVGHGGLTQRY